MLDATSGPPWEPPCPIYVYAVDIDDVLVDTVNNNEVSLCSPSDTISGDFQGPPYYSSMVNGVATFNNSSISDFSWGNAGLSAPTAQTVLVEDVQTSFSASGTINIQ